MADRFNKQAFQEWISRPQTKLFLRFLLDRQLELSRLWAMGTLMDPRDQMRAETLGDLARLEWRNYAEFYDIPVEETDETESAAQ